MTATVQLSANVRDKEYMPAADAKVTAHIIGPDGISAMVDMTPAPNNPGSFHADVDGGEAGILPGRGDARDAGNGGTGHATS